MMLQEEILLIVISQWILPWAKMEQLSLQLLAREKHCM